MNDRISMTYAAENLPPPLTVAEIGVWKGENARRLMKLNLKRLFLIDPYKAYPRHTQKEVDEAMAIALPRIAAQPKAYLTSVIRQESVQAAPLFADGYFDYVYIDGDHRQEEVLKDIRSWYPKVRKGGILAGHDYATSVGVEKAVHLFCEEKGISFHAWRPARSFDTEMYLSDWMIRKEVGDGVR